MTLSPESRPDSGRPAKPDSALTLQQQAARGSLRTFVLLGAMTTIAGMITTVVRSKVVAVTVGPEGLGIVAEVSQVLAFVMVLAQVAAGPNLIARLGEGVRENDAARLQRAFGTSLTLGLTLAIVGGSAAVVIGPAVLPADTWPVGARTAVLLAATGVVGSVVSGSIAGVFVATADVRSTTIHALTTSVLGTLTAIVLVVQFHVLGQFMSLALAPQISVVVGAVLLWRRKLGLRFWPAVDSRYLKYAFLIGGAGVVTEYGQHFALSAIRVSLHVFGGEPTGTALNGNFQAAFVLDNMLWALLFTGLSNFYAPRIASARLEELGELVDRAAQHGLRMAPPLAFSVILLREPIIHLLYDHRFDVAVRMLGIFVVGIVPRAVTFAYAAPLMYRKPAMFLVLGLTGEATKLVLGIFLIRFIGPVGAAFAVLGSVLTYMLVALPLARRTFRVSFRARHAGIALIYVTFLLICEQVLRVAPLAGWLAVPVAAIWLWRSGVPGAMLAKFGRGTAT